MNRQLAIFRAVVWQQGIWNALLLLTIAAGSLVCAYALRWRGASDFAQSVALLIALLAFAFGAGSCWERLRAIVSGFYSREDHATVPQFRTAAVGQLLWALLLLVLLPTLALLPFDLGMARFTFAVALLVALSTAAPRRFGQIVVWWFLLFGMSLVALQVHAFLTTGTANFANRSAGIPMREIFWQYTFPVAVLIEAMRVMREMRQAAAPTRGLQEDRVLPLVQVSLDRGLRAAVVGFRARRDSAQRALRVLGFGLLFPGFASRWRWIALSVVAIFALLFPPRYAVGFASMGIVFYYFALAGGLRRTSAEREACFLLPKIGGRALGNYLLGLTLSRMIEPVLVLIGLAAVLVASGRMQFDPVAALMIAFFLLGSASGVLPAITITQVRDSTAAALPLVLPIAQVLVFIAMNALANALTASRGNGPWVALLIVAVIVAASVHSAIQIRRHPLLARDQVR